MRISRGAKSRAEKQQRFNILKAEGRAYYFGDAKFQRERLNQLCDAINAKAAGLGDPSAGIDKANTIHRAMRRIGKFYGLKNKYRGAPYLGPVRSAAQ